MEDKQCKDCCYFLQHYTFDNKKIFRVFCGHCTRNAPKHKRPYTKGCDQFAPRPENENPFVSKEYLSKELLRYMLSLELLPEIHEQK